VKSSLEYRSCCQRKYKNAVMNGGEWVCAYGGNASVKTFPEGRGLRISEGKAQKTRPRGHSKKENW